MSSAQAIKGSHSGDKIYSLKNGLWKLNFWFDFSNSRPNTRLGLSELDSKLLPQIIAGVKEIRLPFGYNNVRLSSNLVQ